MSRGVVHLDPEHSGYTEPEPSPGHLVRLDSSKTKH